MTMGPEPMRRIFFMSVRRGICGQALDGGCLLCSAGLDLILWAGCAAPRGATRPLIPASLPPTIGARRGWDASPRRYAGMKTRDPIRHPVRVLFHLNEGFTRVLMERIVEGRPV